MLKTAQETKWENRKEIGQLCALIRSKPANYFEKRD